MTVIPRLGAEFFFSAEASYQAEYARSLYAAISSGENTRGDAFATAWNRTSRSMPARSSAVGIMRNVVCIIEFPESFPFHDTPPALQHATVGRSSRHGLAIRTAVAIHPGVRDSDAKSP